MKSNCYSFFRRQPSCTKQRFDLLFWGAKLILLHLQTAMDNFEWARIICVGKHHQLAATKVADRARESRTAYLFLDSRIFGIEKYRPSVKCDAVADLRQAGCEHRHGSALVTDVIVNMMNFMFSQALSHNDSL